VVTGTLVFEGEGRFTEYAGGYDDWELYQRQVAEAPATAAKRAMPPSQAMPGARREDRRRKLSYNEQRELKALPAKIEALEAEQADLHARMGERDFYRQPGATISATIERLASIKNELEASYERWQELESLDT
jgi:ATP-binding cassette subfamily F protein uup